MKKIIVVLVLFLIFSPCLAAKKAAETQEPAAMKQSKTLQGDFQVFKLGDSRKRVIKKIGEYIKAGKTDLSPGAGNRIILKPDNLQVSFTYQKNKLYLISILYETGYKGINDRREIVKYLKDLLTNVYGQPAADKGYPEKTEPAQVYLCVNWAFKRKNVDIVVRTDYRNYPEVTVEIYDPQIRAKVDPGLVKDFG